MDNFSEPERAEDIDAPDFIPVPLQRVRHDGWTPQKQHGFLRALTITGSVAPAARMVGMSRKSAYALRERVGAESFAAAWDIAIGSGRARHFDYQFARALNGVTTIRVRLGGAVDIGHGRDGRLSAAAMNPPPRPHSDRAKGDIR
ncbi:MAG TPA: hypothetical protein VGN36_04545 [Sphingorhabdus sp.]|nr:hypothetical protein [Sphingorhabdus sp.]